MTTVTVAKLAAGQLAGAAATLYTAPAATTVIVKEIWLANTDTASHTYTLYVVASGGAAADSNAIAKTITISANSSIQIEGSTVLATGDFLSGFADTANKLTYTISGVKVT